MLEFGIFLHILGVFDHKPFAEPKNLHARWNEKNMRIDSFYEIIIMYYNKSNQNRRCDH